MGAFYGFLVGTSVGSGITLALALSLKSESDLDLGDAVYPGGAIQSATRQQDKIRGLRVQRGRWEREAKLAQEEVARLTKALASAEPGAAAPTTDPVTPPPGATQEAILKQLEVALQQRRLEEEKRRRGSRKKWRALTRRLRGGATAAERAEAFRLLREALRGNDAEAAKGAAQALVSVGDKLTPAEAQLLAEDFAAVPAGSKLRVPLAAVVARAWAQSARLSAFLDGLPRTSEPKIREAILRTLDRDPSPAYRDFVVRLSREETDPDVLDELWDEDRMVAALTRDSAPQLVGAIEPRLRGTTITDGKLRGRGYYALALAGVHDPSGAAAAIERLVAAETNPRVKAYGQAVLETVRTGEANFATLERHWKEHRRNLRDRSK